MKFKKGSIIGVGSIAAIILSIFVFNIFSERGVCLACTQNNLSESSEYGADLNNSNMQKNQSVENKNSLVKLYEIHPDDVVRKIQNQENVILLDVRSLEENEVAHLENSLLLPVTELSISNLEKIGLGEDQKNQEIIVYCRSGNRSKAAYDLMKSFGFENVKSIAGGMVHWETNDLPFVVGGK